MNIFILDEDPKQCAQYHCDKHIVKMILESAQMLSTAVRHTGIDAGYKATHQNHPCNKWVRESICNYHWLWELSYQLNKEWQYRYGHTRNHKSFDMILTLPDPELPLKGLTPFAKAMPKEFTHFDSVSAYRKYYRENKAHIASWKKRGQPTWWR
jgi:hypothetical protein